MDNADKALFLNLAETMERQVRNAKALTPNRGWVICLGNGNTFATLKVISETAANTSINFAGTWDDAKRFDTSEQAILFMRRFAGQHVEWSVRLNKDYAAHVIKSYSASAAQLREALKAE